MSRVTAQSWQDTLVPNHTKVTQTVPTIVRRKDQKEQHIPGGGNHIERVVV